LTIRNFLRLFAHLQLMPALENGEETLIGGQAVLEGVMMRAPHSYCVAVRMPNGEIVTEAMPLQKVSEKYPVFRFPILRGLGTLGQALGLGFRALRFSANAALAEEDAKEQSHEIPTWALGLNIAVSVLFFIALYKLVPLYLATELKKIYTPLENRLLFNLVDGAIRLAIFVGFLYIISRWKEIHRVFEYHGAEHRVVFNFESGKPVNVETAQSFPTWHPRCGTSFLIVVMLLSIVFYALLPFDSFLLKLLGRIVLLPVIAGVSYEVIRFAAKHRGGMMAALTAPGLWLQRITTQPPAGDQTEVAIRALEGAMALEKSQGGELVVA
jgi:uncharacterized protein YqhQ